VAGQVLGTPYYMSPEQWGEISRDGNPEIDGRTDIYSLGLVAYEMISGKRPYAALTLHELRREHISVSPTSLWGKCPDVPRSFSEAIDRAISKDRGDRQATAGELAAQLRTGLGDTTSQAPAGRTLPDMPYPESSRAQTRGSSGALDTKSDVNAATIVTIDAVPTTPPSIPAPVAPLTHEPPEQQTPRVSAADDMASSVTVLQAPKTPADLTGQQKSRGKPLLFIGAALLLLILVVVGVGGFFAVNWLKAKPDDSSSTTDRNRKTTKVADPANPGTTATEFGRYWLEVLPNASVTQPMRVAGAVPLASGQAFKFHFEFGDNGFLYIIGPGERNQLTAFLTAKPKAISGLETNQVTKGADFSFPSGDEHWLELDKKPGTENYTLIFSPEPLSAPAFLSSEATGKPLSETEQADLSDFLAKSKTSEPVTEINDKDAAAPFVAVRVPQSEGSGAPVIFQVRIQHK